jgi:hypothetical protein
MSKYVEVLKELGATSAQIALLEKDDTDVTEVASQIKADQQKVFLSSETVKTEIENQKKNAVLTKINTTKKKVSDILGLGKSRSELDDMDFDDFMKEAETFYKSSLESASKGTEETWRNQVSELKTKMVELNNALEEKEQTWSQKYTQAEQEFQNRIESKEIENKFTSAFTRIKNWDNPEKAEIYGKLLRIEVESDYNIRPDGTVLSKDGTPAIRPDGKGTFESILSDDPERNPLLYYAEKNQMLQKSNGGGAGGNNGQHTFTGSSGNADVKLTGRALEMAQRFESKLSK